MIADPLAVSRAFNLPIALPLAVSKLPKRLSVELVYDNIDELNVLNKLTDVKALLSNPSNKSAFEAYDAVVANEDEFI